MAGATHLVAVTVDFTTCVDRRRQVCAEVLDHCAGHLITPGCVTALLVGASTRAVRAEQERFVRRLEKLFANLPIGVSRVGRGADRVELVAEARRAAMYASLALAASPTGVDAHPLEEAMLASDVLSSTMTALLDPLADHQEFIHTLYLYLAFDRDRQRVARHLAVHARTVDYRLRRIAALTGLHPQTVSGAGKLLAALISRTHRRLVAEPGGQRSNRPVFVPDDNCAK
ncbi:helix-turn-helix domain-containing protein [Umezawaea sp. Da 62-37]|uniref:helix-turn-helix domain-containing protein n=1 Tax=Umezawaea sp. Da 62-37 TaxID=3075927 RepID=UPI0028F71587|nr:helix-turn-helix domain-containing protein [Umezawaea sp. Da 62-37]WNV85392.1 helix-turn-helix domain-containing protein [Umezawaea sp. Da 62-37]